MTPDELSNARSNLIIALQQSGRTPSEMNLRAMSLCELESLIWEYSYDPGTGAGECPPGTHECECGCCPDAALLLTSVTTTAISNLANSLQSRPQ